MSHADLDYGPLAPVEVEFRNLLTGRTEPVGDELAEVARSAGAARQLAVAAVLQPRGADEPGVAVQPGMVRPGGRPRRVVGVAMSCPGCGEVSLNLVSGAHLDVPFYHDRVVRYVDRPFGDARDLTVEGFHHQLHSARFDTERADLL